MDSHNMLLPSLWSLIPLFFFSSRRRYTRFNCDWSSYVFFFFSSRRRHTRFKCDWSSHVCSSDLNRLPRRSQRFLHLSVYVKEPLASPRQAVFQTTLRHMWKGLPPVLLVAWHRNDR